METAWGIFWFFCMVAICLSPAALVTYLDYLYKKKDKEDDDGV